MLTYDEALDKIIQDAHPLPSITVPIGDALGLVLAEDVAAPQPVPPFRNSAMDGFALRYEDADGALTIVGTVRAGDGGDVRIGRGEAVAIMTGAVVPDDADTVVPIEDCEVDGDRLMLTDDVRSGQCVRPAGQDVAAGSVVLRAGQSISPGVIAMCAAVGRANVVVHRRPRVGIIATGDELVPPGSDLRPGQIYNSNAPAILAQVTEAGGEVVEILHAIDDRDSLRAAFDACADCDVVISTGGVSVGEFDFVKEIFAERGTVDFWKVAIRPGKPLAYGHLAHGHRENAGSRPPNPQSWGDRTDLDGTKTGELFGTNPEPVFFGLPGNPVSSMVTFELFVRPVIRRMLGYSAVTRPVVKATLEETVRHGAGRRSFQRGIVRRDGDRYFVKLSGGQDSGMLHAIASANSLIIIPEDRDDLVAGDSGDVMIIDPSTVFSK
jgi:molybdopterin molybdotransferase